MSGVRGKVRQLKYKLKHDFLSAENVMMVVTVTLCLMWTCQSIEAMGRNWELTEKLKIEQKNLELLKLEVEMAELTNEYLQTDEYQELMARKLAGKQLPGEHMVAMPENSETAKKKHEVVVRVEEEAEQYTNFEKWIMYLFPNR